MAILPMVWQHLSCLLRAQVLFCVLRMGSWCIISDYLELIADIDLLCGDGVFSF